MPVPSGGAAMVNRRATICLLAVAAVLLTAGMTAAVSVGSQTRPLAITHVNVVDVVDGRVVPNSTVTIRGATIASVTQKRSPPAGMRVVDGRGAFLIPGLWDMHAHVQAS